MVTSSFSQELEARLTDWQGQGLRRELRWLDGGQAPHIPMNGAQFLNFSSNDYLGLANDAAVSQAARQAIDRFGVGAGASRLICGSLPPHQELERVLAAYKGTEAALTFPAGYMAALGAITALMGRGDFIVIDKLAHACLVDAARLAGARLRVFPHNDPEGLRRILRWIDRREPESLVARPRRVLVVTESIFSMDGDFAPLRELVEIKDRHGAWLLVDEAHATGLYGSNGCGLVEASGLAERVEIQMGTLSKAVGAAGGYIAGSRLLVDYLVNRARAFIFTTAPMPAMAAAATAALRFIQSPAGEQRRHALWQRVAEARSGLGLEPGEAGSKLSAIIPIAVGEETAAMEQSAWLRSQGFLIPAVRYPAVARGRARLRLTVSAAHSAQDVERLVAVFSMMREDKRLSAGP
jgi:8-amino-7-oxononanoate synthase